LKWEAVIVVGAMIKEKLLHLKYKLIKVENLKAKSSLIKEVTAAAMIVTV